MLAPAELVGRTPVWSSSDPKVATVDPSTGKVTGVAEGPVTIPACQDTPAKTKVVIGAAVGVTSNGYLVPSDRIPVFSDGTYGFTGSVACYEGRRYVVVPL